VHASSRNHRTRSRTGAAALGAVLLLLVGLGSTGCFYSRRYKPSPGYEQILYARAHRDLDPIEVRIAPERYRERLVMWTGVVTAVDRPGSSANLRVTIEHRYWDELEYWSEDGVYVRLWPRGEGNFACTFVPEHGVPAAQVAQADDMIIAYGCRVPDPTPVDEAVVTKGIPLGCHLISVRRARIRGNRKAAAGGRPQPNRPVGEGSVSSVRPSRRRLRGWRLLRANGEGPAIPEFEDIHRSP